MDVKVHHNQAVFSPASVLKLLCPINNGEGLISPMPPNICPLVSSGNFGGDGIGAGPDVDVAAAPLSKNPSFESEVIDFLDIDFTGLITLASKSAVPIDLRVGGLRRIEEMGIAVELGGFEARSGRV